MMKRLISRHLGEASYRHLVISLRDRSTVGAQLEAMGVEVMALGMSGPLSAPRAIMQLVRHIRRLAPDVVQTWMYHADLVGGLAARIAGVRQVIWGVRATYLPHGVGTARATTMVRSLCARLSSWVPDKIVYVADSARVVHEGLGYDPARSLVIPNAYEVGNVSKDIEGRVQARNQFGIPEDALVIGSAGRYNALKDYPTFIAAAAIIGAKRPEVRFALAGRGLTWDNAELADLIAHNGLADRFHLVGEQQGLDDFFVATDIFCLHSTSEGFPNVVAEAMAKELPCVVTDVGAAALIVGDTGLIVAPQSPYLLSEALDRLASETPETRNGRGQRARERISSNFSLDAIGQEYEALYLSVTQGSGS